VFFYAKANGRELAAVAEEVKSQIVSLLEAFKRELAVIDSLKTCACDACDHVHDLQLKQVLHSGHVEFEKIEQFEKLFGLDVILVHRMLKNSVDAREYVMMTQPVFASVKEFFGLQPERHRESFEGVGEVETLVFYPNQIIPSTSAIVPKHSATLPGKLKWRLAITLNTLLDVWGVRRVKGEFDSLPTRPRA
jgi:hypothetical protein